MSYELSWLLDKRIIHLRAFDVLTTEEYRAAATELLTLFDEGIAPVHIVVDHLDVQEIKFSPGIIKELIFPEQHSNSGWTILVSASKMAAFSINMIVQLNKIPMKTCNTIEEALSILQRMDQSLPKVQQQE